MLPPLAGVAMAGAGVASRMGDGLIGLTFWSGWLRIVPLRGSMDGWLVSRETSLP
jgi:hypothetical protein